MAAQGKSRPKVEQQESTSSRSTKSVPASKVQVTVYVRRDIDSAARNAEYALRSNPDAPDNWSQFNQAALGYYTAHVQELYNDGKPFPQRPER